MTRRIRSRLGAGETRETPVWRTLRSVGRLRAASQPVRPRPGPRLPPDAYAEHVSALFSDRLSLSIGAAAACAMTLVIAAYTGRRALFGIAIGLALVGAARLLAMNRFALVRRQLDGADLRRWEGWYVVGGTAHVGLLGLTCMATFAEDDAFARLASVAGIIAYLVGVPGRSFASTLLVNTQIGAAGVPLVLAMLLADGRYLWVWFLIFGPFLLALKTISNRLSGIFLTAVLRAHELSRLAGRFDTALNNMPHGLAMFAEDGTITVANGRLAELMHVSPARLPGYRSLDDLWTACTEVAADPTLTPAAIRSEFESNAGPAREWVLAMADGRTAAFKRQLMASGGGVLIVEDVTERIRAQEQIAYLAQHDALTGLHNRHSFADGVLALRAARPGPAALLFLDLDHFKAVNDTLGHTAGDRLIVEVARRLRLVAGPASVLARFGGDEFVIFTVFDDEEAGPAHLAGLVIDRLSQPYEVEGHRVVVGASVGIAPARPGASVDTLLTDADLALYQAKANGRGSFRFFEDAMQSQAQARREIEDDLREALARDEFELHFQPIYSLERRAFVVCEALVRWRHPRRGLVSPAEFIPIAEEIGLIGAIGDWVLRRACRECATWPAEVGVAVNVSAVQVRQGDVLVPVRRALHEAGLAPHRLEVEITESAFLHDLPAAAAMLHQLRAAGIGVSLDDFGTGFSSLSYLQSLPFSKVKIDRSFLNGLRPGNRAMRLLSGIARLSVDLGMTVVVEGVESAEQLELVAAQDGVTLIQGYLMSRPLPAERVAAALAPDARPQVG